MRAPQREGASGRARRATAGRLPLRGAPGPGPDRAPERGHVERLAKEGHVEDDADIREDLSALLRDEGYQVETATDGAAALEHLRRGLLPRITLLDLMMPVMDGGGFRAEQLKDPALSSIPVILVSGGGDLREHATGLRASDDLSKPIKLDRRTLALTR